MFLLVDDGDIVFQLFDGVLVSSLVVVLDGDVGLGMSIFVCGLEICYLFFCYLFFGIDFFDFQIGFMGLWFFDCDGDVLVKFNYSSFNDVFVVESDWVGIGMDEFGGNLYIFGILGQDIFSVVGLDVMLDVFNFGYLGVIFG